MNLRKQSYKNGEKLVVAAETLWEIGWLILIGILISVSLSGVVTNWLLVRESERDVRALWGYLGEVAQDKRDGFTVRVYVDDEAYEIQVMKVNRE